MSLSHSYQRTCKICSYRKTVTGIYRKSLYHVFAFSVQALLRNRHGMHLVNHKKTFFFSLSMLRMKKKTFSLLPLCFRCCKSFFFSENISHLSAVSQSVCQFSLIFSRAQLQSGATICIIYHKSFVSKQSLHFERVSQSVCPFSLIFSGALLQSAVTICIIYHKSFLSKHSLHFEGVSCSVIIFQQSQYTF